jgi:hypothetical protein
MWKSRWAKDGVKLRQRLKCCRSEAAAVRSEAGPKPFDPQSEICVKGRPYPKHAIP